MKVLFILPGKEEGNSMIFSKRQIENLTSMKIECRSFFLRSRTNILILFKEYFRYRKIHKFFNPDIVHCHYGTTTAIFAALSSNKPLLITYLGSDLNFVRSENFIKELVSKLFSQLAALRASAIICVSKSLKEKLWWKESTVSILPLGVSENLFRPVDYAEARTKLGIGQEEKIILFNNNAPVKRLDIAEASCNLVKKTFPQARLWTLSGEIPFDKILLLLNASDCLLLCSDSEGSPAMIKEAMACNLPIVSTDVGDVKEIIQQTFPFFISEQEPLKLAEGIVQILSLHQRSNGREILSRLGLWEQKLSQKIIEIYKSILQ